MQARSKIEKKIYFLLKVCFSFSSEKDLRSAVILKNLGF